MSKNRKILRKIVKDSVDLTYHTNGGPILHTVIKQLIAIELELKNNGALEVYVSAEYEGNQLDFEADYLEDDKTYNARLLKEQAQIQSKIKKIQLVEQKERELLAQLKAKYECS